MSSLEFRLQEATAILETMRDQRVLVQSDLWHWEQEYQTAVTSAQRRDQDELQHWLSQEKHYTSALQQWMFQQSEAARMALSQRKAWGYRLLIFLACWYTCGLVLIMEMRTIRQLQSKRDFPPFGEQQRLWLRMIQDAQRNGNSLRSLQAPRSTPRLKECNQEVFSRRRKLDALDNQILLQETRVQVLQQQCAQQP